MTYYRLYNAIQTKTRPNAYFLLTSLFGIHNIHFPIEVA